MNALLLAALLPGVQMDGAWLTQADARAQGLIITEHVENGTRRVTLENKSARVVRPEELGWRKEGSSDFDVEGLKVYLESWQMASPCGVRAWDDEPFDCSDGYLRHCVSTPTDFHRGEKGRFLSDHLCVFRRPDGAMRLYGFTTGKDRFGHFRMQLDKTGIRSFFALSACDRAELKSGASITSEALYEKDGTDTEALFANYADKWAADSSARKRFDAPIGWCSWYFYFDRVRLSDIVKNMDWLLKNKKNGFEKVRYIQLDDGYQTALGDWLSTNEKFPGGLSRYAQEVKSRGFVPALWVAPFMVEENSVLRKEHPDWLVKDAAGNPIAPFDWRDNHKVYVLDGTHPEVQKHLTSLFRTLRKFGIDYVKLDFCMLGAPFGGVFYDRTATRAQALRRGFEAIRAGFGEDGFILGCTTPFGPVVGIVDAMRSSTDITPYWQGEGHQHAEAPTVPNVCRNVIQHNYMCNRLWINDPDTLIVRDDETKLTQSEVELWTEAITLVGGSLMLSDSFPTLSKARMPLVEKALCAPRQTGAFPRDRWENTYPTLWAIYEDGELKTKRFDFDDAHTVSDYVEKKTSSKKGTWVVEAGVKKFLVGRSPADAAAEAEEAFTRTPTDEIVKVDESMSLDDVNSRVFAPGTQVLFKRGGVWRGQLQPRSGTPGHPVVYGAYGEGPKPVIQPSYAKNGVADWKKIGSNLWRTETDASADIGNIIFNGSSKPFCGFKKNKLTDLENEFDFWCDPKTFEVTLLLAENPAKRFSDIELCEKIHCIDQGCMHDVVYDGLSLRYTAAHGIGGSSVKRVTVRNCDISWIGGGYLYYDKEGRGVRYGNGIEFWANCEDVLVMSNRVWECWDAGLTNQSNQDGAVQKNIAWIGNEVWNCEYSYEYWQQGENAKTENVRVVGNLFRDAGKSWGHKQRWNPNAAHLMFYDTTAQTKNFVVTGNRFLRSENTCLRLFNDWRKDLTLTDNKWEAGVGTLCRYHGRPTKNLIYRYPDRLDVMHDDNLAEIESQGEGACVFKATDLPLFQQFLEDWR